MHRARFLRLERHSVGPCVIGIQTRAPCQRNGASGRLTNRLASWNHVLAESFDTTSDSAEWQEVRLPFPGFVPTLFARRVPLVELDTSKLNTVQLTLSKFEYDNELNPSFAAGKFELRVKEIAAYR